MKRLLCIAFVAILVSAQAAAQQAPPAVQSAPPDRIDQLQRGCTLGTATMSYLAGTSTTLSITEWTGGCKNGLRDGVGVLSRQLIEVLPGDRTETNLVENGTIVGGVKVGLWCTSVKEVEETMERLVGWGRSTSKHSSPLGCRLERSRLQWEFTRDTDDRWRRMDWDGAILYPDVFVRVGELEAESNRMVTRYAAGATKGFPVAIPAESKPLNDLIDGGHFVWCLGDYQERLDLRSKNVAILLSSRAATEGDRLQSDIRKLLASPANKAPSDKKQRSVWEWQQNALRSIVTSMILRSVTNATIPYVKSLQPADDLSVLQTGAADYALVVDWTYEDNFVMDQKQYLAFPICPLARRLYEKCQSYFSPRLTLYLIDKDLRVRTSGLSSIHAIRQESYSKPPQMEALRSEIINSFNAFTGDSGISWAKLISPPPVEQAKASSPFDSCTG